MSKVGVVGVGVPLEAEKVNDLGEELVIARLRCPGCSCGLRGWKETRPAVGGTRRGGRRKQRDGERESERASEERDGERGERVLARDAERQERQESEKEKEEANREQRSARDTG